MASTGINICQAYLSYKRTSRHTLVVITGGGRCATGHGGVHSRLQRALDERLAVYERYVVSPNVLMEYVEGTKRTLLTVVADVFDRKLEELSHKGGSRRTSPGVMRR